MRTSEKTLTVQVKAAYKSYGSTPVLKGLNLAIAEGTIYGLLGPSGCGKTTLLSILVGTLQLDSGSVISTVTARADLGYMPQELALIDGLTPQEHLRFYGITTGLTEEEIEKRTKHLVTLLEIPVVERSALSLSGGQQRRLSLAIALIHKPKFLILDEPTVGVDPILNQSIWEQLLFMSQVDKTTILITTHYIEEAKQADQIGLMRDGVILAEGEPLQLMETYGCQSMEDTFLKICQTQQQPEFFEPPKISKQINKQSHLPDTNSFYWHRVRGQVVKQVFWMKRNKRQLLFTMMLPVLNCIMQFTTIGGDPKGLDLGIVNHDSNCSSSIPFDHCDSQTFTLCTCKQLSCRYLAELNSNDVELINFENLDDAHKQLKGGKLWAVMYFGQNFSSNLLRRMARGRFASRDSIDAGEITAWNDRTNYMIREILHQKMTFSFIDFLRKIYGECGWLEQLANIPVKFNDAIHGTMKLRFQFSGVPPAIVTSMFFVSVTFTLSSVLPERLSGSWERAMVSGTTMVEILISFMITQTVMYMVEVILVFLIEFVIFKVPLVGSTSLALLLVIINAYCGLLFGFIIAFTSGNVSAGSMQAIGFYFALTNVSGLIWPVEGLSSFLTVIYYLFPVATSCEALRSIMFRGWSFSNPIVWIGFSNTIVYIFIYSLLLFGIITFQKLGYSTSISSR